MHYTGSGADILEGAKKKPYFAGQNHKYNILSFSCLSVSRMQTNTVSCNGTKVPNTLCVVG